MLPAQEFMRDAWCQVREMLPAFVFEARPVITVEEAVRGELEVIAWRDGLKRK